MKGPRETEALATSVENTGMYWYPFNNGYQGCYGLLGRLVLNTQVRTVDPYITL